MRELKFRLWDEDSHTYLPDYDYAIKPDGYIICVDGGVNNTSQTEVIEQYTGLKDKNGREIYEGDIVIPVSDLGHRYMEDRGVVKFGAVESYEEDTEYQCWFYEGRYDGSPSIMVLENIPKNIEVIGNIHENKELLDVQ